MPFEAIPELTKEMDVLPASSTYATLGVKYKHEGYSIKYTLALERTIKSYYEYVESIISEDNFLGDSSMSTAAEEFALQLKLERSGQDPRKANVFDDLFGRNKNKWYAWQWTVTALRIPEMYRPNKYETDSQGRKYWPRIVLIGDQEIGEVLIPEGDGRIVVEWDEVFGIPKYTSKNEGGIKHDNHTTHFSFNPVPAKDYISQKYDVAITRGGWRDLDASTECLHVDATSERCDAQPFGGFRLVVGSLAMIKKELIKTNK